jgi:hypothetical protein
MLADKSNFIHYLFQMSDGFNMELLKWIHSMNEYRKLFSAKDDKGQTPLHHFVVHQENTKKIAAIFQLVLKTFYSGRRNMEIIEMGISLRVTLSHLVI